jgi:hypothetical protein
MQNELTTSADHHDADLLVFLGQLSVVFVAIENLLFILVCVGMPDVIIAGALLLVRNCFMLSSLPSLLASARHFTSFICRVMVFGQISFFVESICHIFVFLKAVAYTQTKTYY